MRISLAARVAGLLALIALVVVLGCSSGPPMGEVTGSVIVDGKSPEKGAISFIPLDGKTPTSGGDIKDGKYTAKVYVGVTKVDIRVPKMVGKKKLYDTPDSPIQPVYDEVLPARYNNNTELTLEVKSGRNTKDWDLKSK